MPWGELIARKLRRFQSPPRARVFWEVTPRALGALDRGWIG